MPQEYFKPVPGRHILFYSTSLLLTTDYSFHSGGADDPAVQQIRRRELIQLLLLCLAALAIRCYMATIDPFLHTWDEQFHALVARNMMDNPLVPMLRKGQLLPYNYRDWGSTTVWLHKQPLFMWQMALSMKLFGTSLFAMRLPSLILSTAMVPMIYHLCRNLRASHFTAIAAAGMHAFSFYHLELVSGREGMDHNDAAFSFYVLASLWSLSCYLRTPNWKWAVATGLFSGGAILCKWLTGLVVYLGWGVVTLISRRDRRRNIKDLALSLAATATVAVPWQLYILSRFPLEARHEYAHNNKHISEVVEGHGGNWDHYFQEFPHYFGDTICWLVPVGVLLMLAGRRLDRNLRVAISVVLVFEVLFFSFIPRTKIYTFIIPVLPLGFIAIAYTFDRALQLIRRHSALHTAAAVTSFLLICNLSLQWGEIQGRHAPDLGERKASIANNLVYKNLDRYLRPGTQVVLNVSQWEEVAVMYYNNGIRAHSYCLNPADLAIYAKSGMLIAYFPDRNGYKVPDFLLACPNAYPIPVVVQ